MRAGFGSSDGIKHYIPKGVNVLIVDMQDVLAEKALAEKKAEVARKKHSEDKKERDNVLIENKYCICMEKYNTTVENKKTILRCVHHHICYKFYLLLYKGNNLCCPLCRCDIFDPDAMVDHRWPPYYRPDNFDASVFCGKTKLDLNDHRWPRGPGPAVFCLLGDYDMPGLCTSGWGESWQRQL